jgi:nickel/cobalt transporter (NicO) family protein
MATYDLDRTELNDLLKPNIDPQIRSAVLDYVFSQVEPNHEHGHGHGHDHDHDHDLSWKGLVGMGASAGLIPCPSALVVLLAAVSQHEIALGLLLIVAFSLGLAGTLTALGLAVVYAGRATSRLHIPAWVGTALPALSALVIVVAGIALTAKAVPEL